VKRAPFAAVLGFIAVALIVPISGGLLGSTVPGSPSSRPTSAADATTRPTPSPSPTPTPTRPPTPTPVPLVDLALVPVTNFRSAATTTNRDEVVAVLAGESERYDALALVEADAEMILTVLGLDAPADPDRLVTAASPAELADGLAANRSRLAIIRADEVGPNVRAMAWAGTALFGTDRVASLADWPLTMAVPETDVGEPRYDPAEAWTLVAGGDIMLDRGVYDSLVRKGNGADFMFDGGTAEITSRYCCSSFGWQLPRTARTGNAGAVRELLTAADIAIANFENPAPNSFRWHTSGTVFSADPALIAGVANAGIDWVSLANNHIRDAGGDGILQTIENLEEHGLAHGGAGRNTAAAHEPTILEANGTTIAILGYDAVAAYYAAGPERVGSAQLSAKACREDVAKARAAGAEVVIAFPHWGVEYRATPSGSQQKTARGCIDAGVDLFIGNHAHWAAALEIYAGKPIWYALGNFVFDQTWSEPTMEGITLELTFAGDRLAQARMRPHIILDKAQPNFLAPAGDGKVVMDQLFGGSKGLLGW
jgi:poly-gamma-glutamate synthesis protein (capsule biosynthesis protein)